MSILELEELATRADDMPFCPGQLIPPLPVEFSDDELADMRADPRIWEYRVCGLR